MWGIWQQGEEVTLLLPEDIPPSLPPSLLTLSPQRWRGVKLWGRVIDWGEVGVVGGMTLPYTPCLNISTATSNCTLVPQEVLGEAL
eukprot:gene855-1075_t